MSETPEPPSCPVCLGSATIRVATLTQPDGRLTPGSSIECPACGSFGLDGSTLGSIERMDPDRRWKVSAWLRQMRPGHVTPALLEQALASQPPGLRLRARRLLAALAELLPPGRQYRLGEEHRLALTAQAWCRDEIELDFLLQQVLSAELGWLQHVNAMGGDQAYGLSARGWLELESGPSAESAIGFCAMWFDAGLLDFYAKVLDPAIRACGYEPLRLDHHEHNGNIDDQIIASIRGARFVIADLTGLRGGVYYEAGFAHGLGLPVIFMRRADDASGALHFDVRQQNFIEWREDALPDARRKLENRLRATLGQGPRPVPQEPRAAPAA